MDFISKTFDSDVGFKIYTWSIGDKTKPHILFIHGFLEYSDRYKNLAKFLVDAGFYVVSFDLPGHGLSSGRRGDIENFEIYYKLTEEIISLYELKKPHLFGHSMGGLIAYQVLRRNEKGFKKVILHNPALFIGGYLEKKIISLINPWMKKIAALPLSIVIPFGFPAAKLLMNKETQKKIETDPMIGRKATVRMFLKLVNESLIATKDPLHNYKDLYLIQTKKDPIIDGFSNIDFFKECKDRCIEVEEGLHEPHHDTDFQASFDLILSVLKK